MADSKDDAVKGLDENGIHLFMTDVNEESCAEAIRFILEENLDQNNKLDHLQLIVNSNGGSVTAGFSLIDIMAGSRKPVRTTGIGMLASMGLLIFMSGQKGHRTLTPNTLILSHQWSTFLWGKEHELLASQKEQKILAEMVLRHYKKHTGMKEKHIREYLLPASDMWLTAKEALKYGLCDNIKDL